VSDEYSQAGKEATLVRESGEVAWTQEWEAGIVPHLLIEDCNGDGVKEFVYATRDKIAARDMFGRVVMHWNLPQPGMFNDIAAIDWLGIKSERRLIGLLNVDADQLCFLLSKGGLSVDDRLDYALIEPRLDAIPVSKEVGPGKLWAKTNVIQIPAPVVGIKATRLRVRLTSQDNIVVYDEIIAPASTAMLRTEGACVSIGRSGVQFKFVVGYGPEIWAYRQE
jgi:hypothetical protein